MVKAKKTVKPIAHKSHVLSPVLKHFQACSCASMSLHPMHLGLTFGIVWGVALFAMSSMGIATGANTFVGLIFKQYISMPTAMAGGIFSLVYGFIDGFFGGLIIGSLYNFINKNCKLC